MSCIHDRTNAPTRVALGLLYCKGGTNFVANVVEGHEFLQEAIQLDPTHINALNCLGDLYSGGYDGIALDAYRARGYFARVLKLVPDNTFAKNGLANIKKYLDVQTPRFQKSPVQRVTAVENILKTAELDDAFGFVEEELHSLAQQEVETLLNSAAHDDACNLLVSLAQAEQICN